MATIAFAGVPTGSMKAYEHANVTGITRYNGLMCRSVANDATMGRKMVAVAEFVTNSVNIATIAEMARAIHEGSRKLKAAK